jgi:hypothetical protein
MMVCEGLSNNNEIIKKLKHSRSISKKNIYNFSNFKILLVFK